MRGKKKADLKKLMSVSDNIANLNVERFKNFLASAKVSEEPSAAEMAEGIARPAVSTTLQRLPVISLFAYSVSVFSHLLTTYHTPVGGLLSRAHLGIATNVSRFGFPQALAYDGPAYRGMDAATFSEEDWTFGAGSVRLLSGLYGVLRPADLIQPYRLEMGSRSVCVWS